MDVVERILRYAAVALSLVVLAGWGWFAINETSTASASTAAELADQPTTPSGVPAPAPDGETLRASSHGRLHELVDDANDVVLKPFASIGGGSSNVWVRLSVPAVLALLVYGLGLSTLARTAQGRLA